MKWPHTSIMFCFSWTHYYDHRSMELPSRPKRCTIYCKWQVVGTSLSKIWTSKNWYRIWTVHSGPFQWLKLMKLQSLETLSKDSNRWRNPPWSTRHFCIDRPKLYSPGSQQYKNNTKRHRNKLSHWPNLESVARKRRKDNRMVRCRPYHSTQSQSTLSMPPYTNNAKRTLP